MKDDELLEKYNKILEKIKGTLKTEFHSKPGYKKKYLKAKIKCYNGEIHIIFHNNKTSKKDSQNIRLLFFRRM